MTVFCPRCLDMSVIFIDSLKEAVCTNLTECNFKERFGSWEECKNSLKAQLVDFAEGEGLKIAPWSGAAIQTEMDNAELETVTALAKEIYGVFSEASMEDKDEMIPFMDVPEVEKDIIVQVACYVFNNFSRRPNG